MKTTTLFLAAITTALLVSDILHGFALRHWRDYDAHGGVNLIKWAGVFNPYSLQVRLDQIESLYTGYRGTRSPKYLAEIVLIARSMVRDSPGSVQTNTVYASALIFQATHGGTGLPIAEAMRVMELDPLSVTAIERGMFLLTVRRSDYELFKQLGMRRGSLTTDRLTMRCELCGRGWLEHRK